MAKKNEQPHVLLVTPDGDDHRATFPAELTNLVFGSGYKLKDPKLSVDAAAAILAGGLDDEGQLPVSAPEAVATSTPHAPSTSHAAK